VSRVEQRPVPQGSFLDALVQEQGAYADCFAVTVPAHVSFPAYIEAFYTTSVFRAERLILRLIAGRPSTDLQVRELAIGARNSFAVWTVEKRAETELLLKAGRTLSWLRLSAPSDANHPATTLMFGSAVTPITDPRTGKPKLGLIFDLSLGLHLGYSRILLAMARRRLLAQNP